jgi:hypothetical protein
MLSSNLKNKKGRKTTKGFAACIYKQAADPDLQARTCGLLDAKAGGSG